MKNNINYMKNLINKIFYSCALKKLIFIFLIILSIISVGQGFLNAVAGSQDMQWSPSVLLRDGINPYNYYLNGNENNKIILSQAPNYAHALYVLFQPLAYLQWDIVKYVWAILNIMLSIFVAIIISKSAGLKSLSILLVVLIFLCSTSVRNTIGNGQQSLFILLFFSMILHRNLGSTFLSGISYLKYSFAPPLAFYIFFKNGLLHFVVSCIIGILGLIIFFYMQDNSFLSILIQPLQVSSTAVGLGVADFMSLIDSTFDGKKGHVVNYIYYLIPIIFSLVVSIYCAKKLNNSIAELAVIALVGLISFKHLGYDYVFLLPAFVYFISKFSYFISKFGILLIIYHWFGIKFINFIQIKLGFFIKTYFFISINLISLLLILFFLFFIEKRSYINVKSVG